MLILEKKRYQTSCLRRYLKKLEKEAQNEPKASKKKKKKKGRMREEKSMKRKIWKTIEKDQWNQTWFLEKFNKIDSSPGRRPEKEKTDDQYQEWGLLVAADSACRLSSLDAMDKVCKTKNSTPPKTTQTHSRWNIGKSSSPLTILEIKFELKNLS